MINPVTFAGMPTFGAAAVKVQPSSPVPYVNGYLAADILPAQHLNWFLANLVGDDNLGGAALNHVIAELDNVLTASGMAVAPGDDTQVVTAVRLYAAGFIVTPGATPYTFPTTSGAYEFEVTTGAGNWVGALPVAVAGKYDFTICKIDSGAGSVQLTPNGADVINGITGAAARVIPVQYGRLRIKSVTGGWRITAGQDELPVGTILMYDGAGWVDNSTLPGWYACIAANAGFGCPDLVSRFIQGKVVAGSGAAGGSNTHQIAASELPPHTHPITSGPSKMVGIGSSIPATGGGLGLVNGVTDDGGFANTAIDVRPANYTVIFIRKHH